MKRWIFRTRTLIAWVVFLLIAPRDVSEVVEQALDELEAREKARAQYAELRARCFGGK